MQQIKMYDATSKALEQISFDLTLDKVPLNGNAFACAIRVLRQNWRQGTVGTKSRGEVAFSGKKPWRQKGTGRARAGTRSSPLWRKGGTIFGPQPRIRTLRFSQKQRARVFNNLFFGALEAGRIHGLDLQYAQNRPSTKLANSAIREMGIDNSKILLFLNTHDMLNFASFRNIPNVRILFYDQPNAFDLADCKQWVFLKQDADLFKDMVSKWN